MADADHGAFFVELQHIYREASYVSAAAAAGGSVAHLLSTGARGEAITSAARAEINRRAAFGSWRTADSWMIF